MTKVRSIYDLIEKWHYLCCQLCGKDICIIEKNDKIYAICVDCLTAEMVFESKLSKQEHP